jgi:hypothetical protein
MKIVVINKNPKKKPTLLDEQVSIQYMLESLTLMCESVDRGARNALSNFSEWNDLINACSEVCKATNKLVEKYEAGKH